MEKRGEEYIEIDLFQLVRALWRRAWAIVLAMLICGGMGFAYARFMIVPTYQARALMYVNNSSISVGSTSVSLSDLSASQSLVETYIVILKARLTLNEVIERAGLNYTYEQLNGMISAGAVNETEIFAITATSTDPVEAERIANTITEVLPGKISEIMDGSSVRTVDLAVVPTHRSAPSMTRYTALGMFLGAIFSCGIIVLLELLDEQIRGEDYLLQTYGLPMLAMVPDLHSKGGKGYSGYYSSYAPPAGKEKP